MDRRPLNNNNNNNNPTAPIHVDDNLMFLYYVFKLSDCTWVNLAHAGFLFGMEPEEAAECWRELKRAVELATFNGAVERSNRLRHEAPPSSIFSFMAKKREQKMKEMKETGGEMETGEETTAEAEQKKAAQRRQIMEEASKRKDPVYGPVYLHPADRHLVNGPHGQQTANQPAMVQQAAGQTTNEHANKPDTQRLPSIHDLQPFEPRNFVVNLPGRVSLSFGPRAMFRAHTRTPPFCFYSRQQQPMMTGGQPQPMMAGGQQQPRMTAGLPIPSNNNKNHMSMPGPTPPTNLDPFGARSLSTTAALALSATPASNVNATGDFTRGIKTGAGFTSTGGQTETGNATGTAAPAIGQFRGTAQPKNKAKRVRTESETESEEDTTMG